MAAFIDQYRECFGVEPICKLLPIAPSTYRRCTLLSQQPEKRSARAKRDEQLSLEIQRVWEENDKNYGARKVWKQLNRESHSVARCTVERLMRILGIAGVRRGIRCITTIPDESAEKPSDLVRVSFMLRGPINSGLQTSRMSPLGQGFCISLLSSLFIQSTSLAGVYSNI